MSESFAVHSALQSLTPTADDADPTISMAWAKHACSGLETAGFEQLAAGQKARVEHVFRSDPSVKTACLPQESAT